MFARIEVSMRPEFGDPSAQAFLRRVELAYPDIRRRIRWARALEVYWIDLPFTREELIPAFKEVFWDPVLQWIFTGNLIPSVAGKHGNVQDLMELAPHRPGKFMALEKRFRPGVTDNVARTATEAFEIVLNKSVGAEGRVASGRLVLLEGPELDEDTLATLARDIFCNELIETWTILPEVELKKNDRFHQERIRRDLPKAPGSRASVFSQDTTLAATYKISGLKDTELEEMSKKRLWALSLDEMKAIRDHYARPETVERRKAAGLTESPTDVEMEVLAQTWSEHCKHKIFAAKINYHELDGSTDIPSEIDGLFKTTIAGTTQELQRPWLLSVFSDNAGIVAFDEEDAFCIKVETHNSPSALDPYGGALTGIVGVNRDILGCGLGAKPIFNTNVFCVAPLDYSQPLPERLLHPRRILDGIRRGVEDGGNKSGIPTVNGAVLFDERYLGKPLVYCGTGGFMPRQSAGRACETKEVRPGDKILMVGGRIGKDGIHGATFSSLALDEGSPTSAVQLGDPITQKRAGDFLLEARDLGFYRAVTDNGAGGLSSSVGEMAQLSGGARLEVDRAKVKYPGLKPYELVISESQERMTIAVSPERLPLFMDLAQRRGVEVSELGEFTDSGRFEVLYQGKTVASLELDFLHKGAPRLEIEAEWRERPQPPKLSASVAGRDPELVLETEGGRLLLELMARPNVASKEWMIRQYDHEVQGMSVVKPLHTSMPGTPMAASGPNDGAVLKPKSASEAGLAVGCGINPKLSDVDPYVMGQAVVDEAVRNVLAVGGDFGKPDAVLCLVDNFCWPDPVGDRAKAAALVRACYGMRDAALALQIPFVSGKDSMKNDFRGKLDGKPVTISVPPTLLITAVGKVSDAKLARTSDFKAVGDLIYLLGGNRLGLWGSELLAAAPDKVAGAIRLAEPDWDEARRVYQWLGGGTGREQARLRSAHDVSDGGLLVCVAESLLARGLGAQIQAPASRDAWEFAFGEGFHALVVSIPEADQATVETEWQNAGVPFTAIGKVTNRDRLDFALAPSQSPGARPRSFSVDVKSLRAAWLKEGYWE